MTALLTQLKEDCKDGFMIETKFGPQLVFIRSTVVFMDADGIGLTLGNKGSSGFKPYWLCQNVVGLNHFDLAETIHISNPDIAGYKAHTPWKVYETSKYICKICLQSQLEQRLKLCLDGTPKEWLKAFCCNRLWQIWLVWTRFYMIQCIALLLTVSAIKNWAIDGKQ